MYVTSLAKIDFNLYKLNVYLQFKKFKLFSLYRSANSSEHRLRRGTEPFRPPICLTTADKGGWTFTMHQFVWTQTREDEPLKCKQCTNSSEHRQGRMNLCVAPLKPKGRWDEPLCVTFKREEWNRKWTEREMKCEMMNEMIGLFFSFRLYTPKRKEKRG